MSADRVRVITRLHALCNAKYFFDKLPNTIIVVGYDDDREQLLDSFLDIYESVKSIDYVKLYSKCEHEIELASSYFGEMSGFTAVKMEIIRILL